MNGLQGNYRWKENIVHNFLHRLDLFMVNKSSQWKNRSKDDFLLTINGCCRKYLQNEPLQIVIHIVSTNYSYCKIDYYEPNFSSQNL